MASIKVVSPSEYRKARLELLEQEKEWTRTKDKLTEERHNLPVVEMTKDYKLTTLDEAGKKVTVGLADLFEDRRQLIIYHFMFAPEWEEGCASCSNMGDHIPPLEHLNSRSTSFAAVSRAPIEKIAAYKKRLGWTFPWYSSYGTDFNYDFNVSMDPSIKPVHYNFRNEEEIKERGTVWQLTGEQPGTSVFIRGGAGVGERGKIYHSYSSYARGIEGFLSTFGWLDITPLGRQDKDGRNGLGFQRRDQYTKEQLLGTA